MKIAKMQGHSQVSLSEVPDPEPGPDEVLVRTKISAICGSELHVYREEGVASGNNGHEAAGVIEKVGSEVTNLKPGQRVGASAISGCGQCPQCKEGKYTYCSKFAFIGSMHAEKFIIPARACHKLPDDVSWEVGVLISGDGFGVPYHASNKLKDRQVKTVAIFGAGPIGLGNLIMQHYLGRSVIVVELVEKRLEYARALGAAQTINARKVDDVVKAVRDLSGGMGVDACIEAAGKPETAHQCFGAVRTTGTVMFIGEQGALPLSPSDDFIRRDIWAVGSWFYHFGDFPKMLDLVRGGVPIDKLISHHYPFDQVDEAFRQMAAGQTAKAVLVYD